MMKMRACVLTLFALSCVAASAQEESADHTTTYPTAQGPLTVHWGQPTAPQYGPPPAFAQLDRRGAGYLTSDEATGYALLANDFNYADSNHDGRVSRTEYERWVRAR
jgi:hypothetical protein